MPKARHEAEPSGDAKRRAERADPDDLSDETNVTTRPITFSRQLRPRAPTQAHTANATRRQDASEHRNAPRPLASLTTRTAHRALRRKPAANGQSLASVSPARPRDLPVRADVRQKRTGKRPRRREPRQQLKLHP